MDAERNNIIRESPSGHFRSRRFGIFLVWALLLSAASGAFVLSRALEGQSAASVYLGTAQSHEVSLYTGRAEPVRLVVRAGDEVVFVVRDKSRHNLAEERSRKTDARLVSGEFGEGESYALVFQGKGEFSFYDRMDQDIRVSIVIE